MTEHRSTRVVWWTIGSIATVVLGTLFADIWFDVDYRIAANTSLAAAAVCVNAFTLLYGFRSYWRTNRIGGIFLVKCGGLSLFLTQAALTTWWDDDYPYRQQIRFAIYAGMSIVYVPMLISLWLEQQRDRAGNRAEFERPPGVPPL